MTRHLPPRGRKAIPLASGLLDYFPDALVAVADVSMAGARQHGTLNADGQPTWRKGLSADHPDALLRHLLDRGSVDADGIRHTAKVAWRALALLQTELEAEAALEQFEPTGADRPMLSDADTITMLREATSDYVETLPWPPGADLPLGDLSPEPDMFTPEEQANVERIATALAPEGTPAKRAKSK